MYIISINDITTSKNSFRFNRYENVTCALHVHYSIEVVVVTDGKLLVNNGSQTITMNKGDAVLFLPFDKHAFDSPEYSNCFVVEFSPQLVPDFQALINDKKVEKQVCCLSNNTLNFCDGFLPKSTYDFNNLTKIKIKSFLYPLCCELADKLTFTTCERKYDNTFIDATKYICENALTSNVSLSTVAKQIGVHPAYLSRVFKNVSGMTFTMCVNVVKCSNALRLINENPNDTIAEIAYKSGFGSIRNFNREFKKIYNVTPKNSCNLKNAWYYQAF